MTNIRCAPLNLAIDDLPEREGIYLLTHADTGDTYVGSSNNIRTRIRSHFAGMACGKHSLSVCKLIERSGAKFSVEVLELTGTASRYEAERRWIGKIRPTLNSATVPKRGGCSPSTRSLNVRLRSSTIRQVNEFINCHPLRPKFGTIMALAIERYLEKHMAELPPKGK